MQYRLVLVLLLSGFLLTTGCTKNPFYFWRSESKAQENTLKKQPDISRQAEPPPPTQALESPADVIRQNPPLSPEKPPTKAAENVTTPPRDRKARRAKKPQKPQRPLSPKPPQTHKPSEKTPESNERQYYASLENKLQSIQREIEERGYVLDETNNPKIVKKDVLNTYDGYRLTFKISQGKYLPILERQVEKDLEKRYAKNFRRIYRGKMSKVQEGIYVVDFIPQEHLSRYKKKELHLP